MKPTMMPGCGSSTMQFGGMRNLFFIAIFLLALTLQRQSMLDLTIERSMILLGLLREPSMQRFAQSYRHSFIVV
jgi:hypothetical protein